MARPILVSIVWMLTAMQAPAQGDRRDRQYPELTVETGARTAACDALIFSPDGKSLLAAGDDKVVRDWPVNAEGIDIDAGRVLRWPSWREQRGGIKAISLSPDGKRVAVGGFGLLSAAVVVIERDTGAIRHATFPKARPGEQDFGAVMAVAYHPDGDRVVYGTADGSVWEWQPGADGEPTRLLFRHESGGGNEFNRVRMLGFLADGRLISVAEGTATGAEYVVYDQATAKNSAYTLFPAGAGAYKAFRAALSADARWMAVAAAGPRVVLVELPAERMRTVELDEGEYPRSVAFSRDGTKLAVAVGSLVSANPGQPRWWIEADDQIRIYDLTGPKPIAKPGPAHTGKADALAWHPDGRLAVAGGDHNEVRLWDLARPAEPLDEVIAGGRSLYEVRISGDGRFVALRNRRDPRAVHPSRRGTGDWSVIDTRRRRPSELPPDVGLTPPLTTAAGWTVESDYPDTNWRWYAKRGDQRFALPWDRDRMGEPLCYAFAPALPDRPVRLAVGHYNGFSLFELSGAGAKRVRTGIGHTGRVMSLSISPDGDWLATASDDQTVSAWNLKGWASQGELGAGFEVRDGKLFVATIDAGSPAWEAGLKEGDEVILLIVNKSTPYLNRSEKYRDFFQGGDPGKAAAALRNPEPGKELYFGVRREGRDGMIEALTTVIQRPMWRLFPAYDRGGEAITDWVMWMWLNSYYLTSTNGDFLIGWHVNAPIDPADVKTFREPQFYKAEQFRDQFEKPAVIAALINTRDVGQVLRFAMGPNPQPVRFDDLEPAPVRITRVADDPRRVNLYAEPRGDNPDLLPRRVDLWVNDFLLRTWEPGGRPFRAEGVEIPEKYLRRGDNRLTLQTFNDLGGRGEATLSIRHDRAAAAPRLWGVTVGINDYGQHREVAATRGDSRDLFGDLKVAVRDAEMLARQWATQEGRLYTQATVEMRRDAEADRAGVLAEMDRIAREANPDDLMVLFLSGHGDFRLVAGEGSRREFVFACSNYDRERYAETGITTRALYDKLSKIPCRKLVFLDACHSGGAALNPVREFTPAGMGPTILAACDQNEFAFENSTYGNGLFTYAVLEALGDRFHEADGGVPNWGRRGELDSLELFEYVRRRLPGLLVDIGKPGDVQNPVCFPRQPEMFPIAKP